MRHRPGLHQGGGDRASPGMGELFARLVFEAGLPPIRLHDLRPGAATLALAAGV